MLLIKFKHLLARLLACTFFTLSWIDLYCLLTGGTILDKDRGSLGLLFFDIVTYALCCYAKWNVEATMYDLECANSYEGGNEDD